MIASMVNNSVIFAIYACGHLCKVMKNTNRIEKSFLQNKTLKNQKLVQRCKQTKMYQNSKSALNR